MPLVPNFTASQPFGSPSEILLTDTSTGSDNAVTSRRIYITMPNGTSLTNNTYITWAYADLSKTVDVLTKDSAVSIKVEWVNVSGGILYTKIKQFGFTQYNEEFDYGLTQMLTANPLLINDNRFFENKINLRISIDSGNQALNLVGDLFAAQQCYDRATTLRKSSEYYFNING